MKDETAPFPPRICKQYDITQQERIAIKMDSGIPMDEAERQMLREEKLERFMNVDEQRKRIKTTG